MSEIDPDFDDPFSRPYEEDQPEEHPGGMYEGVGKAEREAHTTGKYTRGDRPWGQFAKYTDAMTHVAEKYFEQPGLVDEVKQYVHENFPSSELSHYHPPTLYAALMWRSRYKKVTPETFGNYIKVVQDIVNPIDLLRYIRNDDLFDRK